MNIGFIFFVEETFYVGIVNFRNLLAINITYNRKNYGHTFISYGNII